MSPIRARSASWPGPAMPARPGRPIGSGPNPLSAGSGRMVALLFRRQELVRAEGLEPPRAVKLRGFSYRLRLSPPRRAGRVCGLDYPFTVPGGAGVRCCPSSLYTFPAGRLRPGLARDRHVTGFPEFGQFCIAGFPASTQVSLKSAAAAIPPRPRVQADETPEV